MIMKRRAFIKTGLIFVPAIASGQGFGSFSHDQPFFAKTINGTDCGTLDSNVTAWAAQVVSNGGAAPSDATKVALNCFYLGLSTDGILSKMIAVNCFVPDNLIASITPLIQGSGFTPWTNTAFVSGDLTINGLKGGGDVAGTALDTGFVPSTGFSNSTSCGMTIYNSSDNSNACEFDMSATANPGAAQAFSLYHSCSSNDIFDSYDQVTSRVSGADASFLGYVSANRTASNAVAIYKANSSTAHVAVVTGSGSGGSRPVNSVFCFANSLSGALGTAKSTKRFSLAAIHLGLTSGESSLFYDRIQTLRTALGGGFV